MDAIAISIYDKFQELSILHDIIRENWSNDYYLTVSCSHPEGKSRIDELDIDIDAYNQIGDIPYSSSMSGVKSGIYLHTRILTSIRDACQSAVELDADKVMHVHADAWPLSETQFIKLGEELERRGSAMAVRGHGLSYRTKNHWTGEVKDQFFMFDSDHLSKFDFWDFNPLDLLPHTAIHNSLMYPIIGNLGLSNIYWFSTPEEDLMWDGQQPDPPFTSVRPGIFNPNWKFLHISTEDFPDQLGRHVQSYYLREHGLQDGKFISNHLNKYGKSKTEVFDQIHRYEEKLQRKLGLYGVHDLRRTRMIPRQEEFLDRDLKVKLYIGVLSRLRRVFFSFLGKIDGFPKASYSESQFRPFQNIKSSETEELYYDSEWPDDIANIYRENIDSKDINKFDSNWFDQE